LKIGDLVESTGFGPNGNVGEVGMIVKYEKFGHARVPWVLFQSSGAIRKVAEQGLRKITKNPEGDDS